MVAAEVFEDLSFGGFFGDGDVVGEVDELIL